MGLCIYYNGRFNPEASLSEMMDDVELALQCNPSKEKETIEEYLGRVLSQVRKNRGQDSPGPD
ncbi:MAG: hypothetical protein FJY10_08880 [Bacteroidetes bacterium]|nr:hypothetical protein [Bacteroidota bacterium]